MILFICEANVKLKFLGCTVAFSLCQAFCWGFGIHCLTQASHQCILYRWGKCKLLGRVRLSATPRTIQSMEFSRSGYWSGCPFPSPGAFPNPGIEPRSPTLQTDSFFFFFYCSGFCHTLTWISHGFTCVPHPDPPSHLPLHLIPLGFPRAPGPSACLIADRFFTSWATREGHRWGSWASIR